MPTPDSVNCPTNDAPQRPWLAALMSAVLPGFGQLYNGQLDKGIWLFLGFALLSVPGVALIALCLPAAWTIPALALGLLAALGIWIGSLVDAWRTARRPQINARPAWVGRGVFALVFVVCDLVALPALIEHVQTRLVSSFHIPSSSMAPGVLQGDVLFADRRYNRPGVDQAVRHGDVAIFTYPNDRTRYYIKRIVGLPGDRVRIDGHAVWLNGQSLSRAHGVQDGHEDIQEAIGPAHWLARWQRAAEHPATPPSEWLVPPGQVFVLGDNRDESKDSRHYSTVPLADVVGKARQIWLSYGKDGVRWSRLGLVIGG